MEASFQGKMGCILGQLIMLGVSDTGHARRRSALMHERGHQFYGTTCHTRCDLASKWAARKLITPSAFLAAAQHEHRIEQIARALWVVPSVVHDYLHALTPEE